MTRTQAIKKRRKGKLPKSFKVKSMETDSEKLRRKLGISKELWKKAR